MQKPSFELSKQTEKSFPSRTVAFAGALATAIVATELGASEGIAITEGLAVLILGRIILPRQPMDNRGNT
jgi:hypothetical protein